MSVHAIEVRNLRFPLGEEIPKYWLGGKRSVSTLLDNLSILFPAGERFFMNSVKAFEGQLRDPKLREEVRAFYQQEALHSREHVRYNQWLAESGYPAEELDARVRALLDRVARLPARWQLGVTCALEHFTALLAQMILGEGYSMQEAHPAMRALWRWHAVEENEHASVAYDVYHAVGGWYGERAVIMLFTAAIFGAKVLEQQIRMMKADGTLFDRGEWQSLGDFLFRYPAPLRRLWGPLLSYMRIGFHPSDVDTTGLVESWRKEFASDPVYRSSAQRTMPAAASA